MGEHLWGEVDDHTLRMTTGLAGGVGCDEQELCGVLSAGVMIIGAQHGRTEPDADDTECNRLVCLYRDRFIEELGHSRCIALRDSGFGGDGPWPCSNLIERAARILLEVLDEAR